MVDEQSIGEQQAESVLDDFQSMDLDMESLRAKFIAPIDRFRSRSAPNVFAGISTRSNRTENVSENILQESRAHTFYRILGLPAIGENGVFFNPGFDPNRLFGLKTQEDVNNAIPQSVKDAISKRESDAIKRYNLFSNPSIDASVYSLALATPRGQKRFMLMDKNIDSLSDFDKQTSDTPERKKFITSKYKKKNGDLITKTYDSISHILRPFITDPVICSQLMPKSGDLSVLIGAPFLESNDREYERGKYVKRPGIEFVLRLRLRQQNIAESNNTSFQQIDLKSLEGDISSDRQREIAAALSNTGVDDVDVDRVLNSASAVELYTLNDLVKTYKGLIDLYVKSIETIERVSKQIVWAPISNIGGPEKGTEVSTGFVIPNSFLDSWEIERRISQLQVKSVFSKTQLDIGDDILYEDFSISEFQNLTKLFDDSLQEAENERARLESEASNALRTIEYISGEVSGLGLVDIFAIYMAMWSVDISVLLNLIDDSSAKRLGNISKLKTSAVESRLSGEADAKDAYKKFENRIINILSYGDKLYDRALGSPNEEEGGDIPRDNTTF